MIIGTVVEGPTGKYGKLLQRTNGEIKKSVRHYQPIVNQVAAQWDTVCGICSQAEQFRQDLDALLCGNKHTQSSL